jgi:hypothetical protein
MKPAELEDKLEHKFRFVRNPKHKDHRWWELKLPGVAPVATFFSHSRDEIRPVLEGKIARQLKVNSSYLRSMIGCTKTRDAYIEHLKTFQK